MTKEPTGDTWTIVNDYPRCDFDLEDARFEAVSIIDSEWHYLCPACFIEHGVGLGLGHGQELITRDGFRDADRLRHMDLSAVLRKMAPEEQS